MRIRVLGRFIAALAILTACLCLLPTSPQVAIAKPIDWQDNSPSDPPREGDNDGVVLKSLSARVPVSSAGSLGARGATTVTTPKSGRYVLGALRGYNAVMKLNYWLFWVR